MAIPLALQDAIFHAEKSFAVEELEEAARLAILLRGMKVRHLSADAIADLNRTFKLK